MDKATHTTLLLPLLAALMIGPLSGCAETSDASTANAAQLPVPGSVDGPRVASAPAAQGGPGPVAADRCEHGALRCASTRVGQVCEGGIWRNLPCDAETSCPTELGEHPAAMCRPLCGPERPGCAFGGDAWVTGGSGLVNRWRMAGPYSRKAIKRFDDTDELLAEANRTDAFGLELFADPLMELEGRRTWKDKKEPSYLLEALVYAPEDTWVRLRPSITGDMELRVNGKAVLEDTAERWLLPDDHRVDVKLKRGVNTVLMRVQQARPRALRAALRVQSQRNGPPPPLLWSVRNTASTAGATGMCGALSFTTKQRPTEEGWSLDVMVEARGLVPATRPDEGAPRFELVATGSRGLEGSPLAIKAMDTEALAEGPLRVSAAIPVSRDGNQSLELRLNGEPCMSLTVLSRRALNQRVLSLAERLRPLFDFEELPEASRQSLEHHLGRLFELLGANAPDTRYVERMTGELERLVARAQAGEDPYATATGLVTRAYRSEMDGQLQPYVVYVPPSYKRRSHDTFPLIVTFHGLNGSPDEMIRITGGIERERGVTREAFARLPVELEDRGAILVAPWGFGNVGQRPPGELDVMRVVEAMKSAYRIDPRRVSITGASLGGTVAFVVPLHYPDQFSMAAPLCGYPNLSSYSSVKQATLRPWETWLIDQRGIANVAENGLHLPMHIVHGTLDDPDRAQLVVDRYRALGNDVKFDTPELGHNVWDYAYAPKEKLLRKMAWRKIPERPRRVRLRTGHYRYTRSHWLTIDRFVDDLAFGGLDAERTKQTVAVETRNVAAFTIDGPGVLAEPTTLKIEVNGKAVGTATSAGPIHLVREGGVWTITEQAGVLEGQKRPGLSGPMDDIWLAPFVIVYGTADPVQTDANRRVAEFARNYNLRSELAMPMMADTEVTEDDLRGRSVVLIGNPRSNPWTARALEPLPVRFGGDGVSFFDRRYEGEQVGLSFIYPSTFDPGYTMVVHAGVTEEGTLSSRHLPEFTPDYLIYDERVRADFGGPVLDRREVIDGGFFSPTWQRRPE